MAVVHLPRRFDNDWAVAGIGRPRRGDGTVVDWYEVDGPYVRSTGTVAWSMQPNTTVGVVTRSPTPVGPGNRHGNRVSRRHHGGHVLHPDRQTAGQAARRIEPVPGDQRQAPSRSTKRTTPPARLSRWRRTLTLRFSMSRWTNRFTGCAGVDGRRCNGRLAARTARIANLNDNTYYCGAVMSTAVGSLGVP